MGGRLIQKFKAEIARLDTVATEAASAYDSNFRTIKKVDSSGDGVGAKDRREHTPFDIVPCQIGSRQFEALRQSLMGNDPDSEVVVWFHFRHLQNLSLVDSTTGRPLINTGDRLVSIKDYWTEDTVLDILTPPGLYVQEATSAGWGINIARPKRNLLQVKFRERVATA
jgi:hypothetical protein